MTQGSTSKKDLLDEATAMVQTHEIVYFRHDLYIPADYERGVGPTLPPADRKTWIPLDDEVLFRILQNTTGRIFLDMGQKSSFMLMLEQLSQRIHPDYEPETLLVRTKDGLRELREDGQLHDPTGSFVPNTLPVMLNEDPDDVAHVRSVLLDWLGGEEADLDSLLKHLAAGLAPHWPTVRYVLLLGSGRNGKSVLLEMLTRLYGGLNCSGVTRQLMAARDPLVRSMNNKLANIVMDGMAEYVKDSSTEKTLIAGESVFLRQMYRDTSVEVRTNGLFIEGLNQEPKSSDKSAALQARLVRFEFPNTYPLNRAFYDTMLSERYVGALLNLLIQNYVTRDQLDSLSLRTPKQTQLQVEHLRDNDLAVQFFEECYIRLGIDPHTLLGTVANDLYDSFRHWRDRTAKGESWSQVRIGIQFRGYLKLSEQKVSSFNGVRTAYRHIIGLTSDAEEVFNQLYGKDEHGLLELGEPLVGD